MMTNTIAQLPDPQGFPPDPLAELLRSGVQRLIEQAVEAELAVLLEAYAPDKTDDGRARLVRHGHLPEREVITGIGVVPVKVPRVRDRGDAAEKVRSTSTILPPYQPLPTTKTKEQPEPKHQTEHQPRRLQNRPRWLTRYNFEYFRT